MDAHDRGRSRRDHALSKVVAHALRHQPWVYELELDERGWVDVESLVTSLRRERRWGDVTGADLARIVAEADKQRYEIVGGRIRALYGHSVPGRIEVSPGAPPQVLFHGTGADALPAILDAGLLPMARQFVHLSVDEETAVAVGRRKGPDVRVLTVAASDAHAGGVEFFRGNEMVWLATHVPPEFLGGVSGQT